MKSHDCSFFCMKVDGAESSCKCSNPLIKLNCNCENAACPSHGGDNFHCCQNEGGRGWIQYLGSVCGDCFWNYPAKYRIGPGPIINLDI